MKCVAALLTVSALLANPPRAEAQARPAPTPQSAADRPVSWKLLFPNLLHDQEHIWSFPAKLVHGTNWIPTTAVLGIWAGLNNVLTGHATVTGTIVAPLSLYAVGLVRRDSKMQHTALLAGEAVADAELLTTALKDAATRIRPAGFSPSANMHDSWFESTGSYLRGRGSFPSGHTIAAFSLATIIARRYGNHRWVPYAAYGLAAAVGFSRLTLSAHFLSDVFMGGALGYSISRFVVLRQ